MSIISKVTDALGLSDVKGSEKAQRAAARAAAEALAQQKATAAAEEANRTAIANAEKLAQTNAEMADTGTVVAGGSATEAAISEETKRKRSTPSLSGTLGINA